MSTVPNVNQQFNRLFLSAALTAPLPDLFPQIPEAPFLPPPPNDFILKPGFVENIDTSGTGYIARVTDLGASHDLFLEFEGGFIKIPDEFFNIEFSLLEDPLNSFFFYRLLLNTTTAFPIRRLIEKFSTVYGDQEFLTRNLLLNDFNGEPLAKTFFGVVRESKKLWDEGKFDSLKVGVIPPASTGSLLTLLNKAVDLLMLTGLFIAGISVIKLLSVAVEKGGSSASSPSLD